MRIHMAALVELANQLDNAQLNTQLLDELPTGLLEVPKLSEESFRRVVEGDYTMKEARKAFPPEFYHFLEENLKAEPESLCRKIIDTDIDKFMAGKPAMTIDDIKRRLPEEFWDLLDHAR